jgi:uncharacterized membrane protein YhhN
MMSTAVVIPFTASTTTETVRGIVIASAAILFFLSDFLLSIYTFIKPSLPIHIACIYTYYIAQFLFAVSIYRFW